jgi:hypothetical protein
LALRSDLGVYGYYRDRKFVGVFVRFRAPLHRSPSLPFGSALGPQRLLL